jgi:hypothetical protein
MSFFSALSEELVERRRRLRRAVGDGRASPFEFLLLAGSLLGVVAVMFTPRGFWDVPWGPMLPLLLVLGYAALDSRRQRALTQGAPEAAVRRRFDRLTLALFGGVAIAGLCTLVYAILVPTPYRYAPPNVPERALEIDIAE